ncbi:MAG: hypothetical protein WA139_05290 [Candidatus Aenigmatarchaeota archaeon]
MKLEMEEKPELKILKHIQSDVSLMKQKIIVMEEDINEINSDLHRELNPEFVKKLGSIQSQKGVRFDSMKDFDEYFSK